MTKILPFVGPTDRGDAPKDGRRDEPVALALDGGKTLATPVLQERGQVVDLFVPLPDIGLIGIQELRRRDQQRLLDLADPGPRSPFFPAPPPEE